MAGLVNDEGSYFIRKEIQLLEKKDIFLSSVSYTKLL